MGELLLIQAASVLPGNFRCPLIWDLWCCSYIDETVDDQR